MQIEDNCHAAFASPEIRKPVTLGRMLWDSLIIGAVFTDFWAT
jgi:hypothetical protein